MSTIADLLTSIKDDLTSRYRSPVLGALVIPLILVHWKVVIFLLTEKQSATNTIEFIEKNTSKESLGWALLGALGYAVLLPWLEHAVDRLSSIGKRRRNEFQTREREREVGIRKLIALELSRTLELETSNKSKASVLADTELAKTYQGILAGEHFGRWLTDLAAGPINSGLNNSIVNYLQKVDSIEGKFIDHDIEQAHVEFVSAISTLLSAINDSRGSNDEAKRADLIKFSQTAKAAQQKYREIVRHKLEI
jgi:hypothetical protein